ncbi:MAG: hypothetical protein LBH72_05025 [Proteiniphilum sp.]|jgi:DNA-binding CsgD family transcriptional regulator|nr:hypothetical protein [Proteiniphilum sp.]
MTLVVSAVAQDIPFIPPVYNYTTDHYGAGNQNWAVAQGRGGVLYFGNDYGMLSYDGVNWELHSQPGNHSVKSIYIDVRDGSERIYTGSFEEFGYFESDGTGLLLYRSLSRSVEDHRFHNDEIWSIFAFREKIYFQSFSAVFVYDGVSVRTLKPHPSVLYFFPAGEEMFAQLIGGDFCLFDGESFHPVFTRERWNGDNVIAMLPCGGEWLLVTSKNGLFRFSGSEHTLTPWNISAWSELRQSTVNRAIASDGSYIFGTISSGIFAIDGNGELMWHIDRSNGLNNNTVLALFRDRDRTVWAALDNGISNIRTHSLLSFFEPADSHIGPVEDILFHDDRLYLATNQGVYSYPGAGGSLFRVPEFDNQSWFIKCFDDQIFVGHNLGTSLLRDLREVRIEGARTGGMDMKRATVNGRDVLLESSYTSLFVHTRDSSGKWVFSHAVEGFSDLIKNLETDHAGNIWAGHMYKGVYRLRLDGELRKAVEKEYFPSFGGGGDPSVPRPIKVMKLRGRIVFADGEQFFTYDDIDGRVIPLDPLNGDLPGLADTHRIVHVSDNLFWFVRHREYVLIEYRENRYTVKDRIPYSILNSPPNAGRANLLVTGDSISYFCLNGGIGKYSFSEERAEAGADLQIGFITFHNRNKDQVFRLDPSKKGVIAYRNNNVTFRFLYPEFSRKIFHVESYLQGYDSRWVSTDGSRSASYHNLPAGDYTLHARVKDSPGQALSAASYPFRIRNPWYKTWWAYLLYVLVTITLAGCLIREHLQRVVRKKQKLFAEQENRRLVQIERQEREIATLQNEKLEAELIHKGKELASAAMMLINHSEFLKNLRESIQTLILAGKINRIGGNELLSMIGKNLSEEDEWSLFQENFDLIHANFFRKLKERYPSLTPVDLKLCALLRLNYSSKEIADMLNISVRGVEAARYRLRKKLNLSETDNLVDFMIKLQ